MSSGFNTDVRRGERVFHVQTEDRGPQHAAIDTVVYRNGQIVYRHSSDYAEFARSAEFSPEILRQRVEGQHRGVIEALRAGTLDAAITVAEEDAARASGIQVILLNAGAWLAAGKVSLEIGVVRRADQKPVPGASVTASIAGALQETKHPGTSDDRGRANIAFPLPQLGKGELALVIEASADSTNDEVRFAMRSRAKTAQGEEQ